MRAELLLLVLGVVLMRVLILASSLMVALVVLLPGGRPSASTLNLTLPPSGAMVESHDVALSFELRNEMGRKNCRERLENHLWERVTC